MIHYTPLLITALLGFSLVFSLVDDSFAQVSVAPSKSTSITVCSDDRLDEKVKSWMGKEIKRGASADNGKYRHYENNASIYCHEDTGPHEIHGAIREKYSSLDWEHSYLGYPITDELGMSDNSGIRYSNFQGGVICWMSGKGAWEVNGMQGPKGCVQDFILTNDLPIIKFDKPSYENGEDAVITVLHKSQNQNSNSIESVKVKFSNGKSYDLIESNSDSGFFSKKIPVNDLRLGVSSTIKAFYSYLSERITKEITTSAMVGIGFGSQEVYWKPNLDSKLNDLKESSQPDIYASKKLLPYENGFTIVNFHLSDSSKDSQINALGKIQAKVGSEYQMQINISELDSLSQKLGSDFIGVPQKIIQHEIISEGTEDIGVNIARNQGLSGKGIKIAVLDLAFDLNNAEIKKNIDIQKSKIFRNGVFDKVPWTGIFPYEYVHGTSVAEIITDIAPDVKLYLYTIGTEVEFLQAIDEAISQKVDIIAMSAGWLNYPTNGNSPMTKKIEEATRKGVVVILSAGNYAQSHWEGKFDSFGGNQHKLQVREFSSNQQQPILVYLIWEDRSKNFDLFLEDSAGIEVDKSINNQKDTNSNLVEFISFMPEKKSGPFFIIVKPEIDVAGNSSLEIFSPSGPIDNPISSGSVGVPTDSNGSIVVGAMPHGSKVVAPYSSQGPTNNNLSVPVVLGPDKVKTSAFNELGQAFEGTSAAAPHIAGVVALFLEKNNGATPEEVKKILIQNTKKFSDSSSTFDNVYGYGLVDASFLGKQPDLAQTNQGSLEEFQEIEDSTEIQIPSWIKQQMTWWVDGITSDDEFILATQYLMKNDIIKIPNLPNSSPRTDKFVPDWIKNTAKWWTEDQISDSEFAKALEYLVNNGIIVVR